jgi:hypothetical protein
MLGKNLAGSRDGTLGLQSSASSACFSGSGGRREATHRAVGLKNMVLENQSAKPAQTLHHHDGNPPGFLHFSSAMIKESLGGPL